MVVPLNNKVEVACLLHGAVGLPFEAFGDAAWKKVLEFLEGWCTVGRKVAGIRARRGFTQEKFGFIKDTTPVG